MDRADPRASEHRHRRFGDHRHVDHDAIAAPDAACLEQIGEAACFAVELAIGETAALARLVAFPHQRDLVATGREMAIEAIERQIQLAVGIPADAEIGLMERAITGLGRETVPIEPARLVEPESVGVGIHSDMKRSEPFGADGRIITGRNWINRVRHY